MPPSRPLRKARGSTPVDAAADVTTDATTDAAAPISAPPPASTTASTATVDTPGTLVSSVDSDGFSLVTTRSPHSARRDGNNIHPPSTTTATTGTTTTADLRQGALDFSLHPDIDLSEDADGGHPDTHDLGIASGSPSGGDAGGDSNVVPPLGGNPTIAELLEQLDALRNQSRAIQAHTNALQTQSNALQAQIDGQHALSTGLSKSIDHINSNITNVQELAVANSKMLSQTTADIAHTHNKYLECKSEMNLLSLDVHNITTKVDNLLKKVAPPTKPSSPPSGTTDPSSTIEETFAAVDATLSDGITSLENVIGSSLDRNIASHSTAPTSGPRHARFGDVDDKWKDKDPYDSEAAYAHAHPPTSSTTDTGGSDGGTGGGVNNGGTGGGVNIGGGGSPNSYGDGLSPRYNGPNSPRHCNALMRNLTPDILLWHAGGPRGDPVCGIDLMEAEDVETLEITPHPAVIIAEDHWHMVHNWDNPRWLQKDSRDFHAQHNGYSAPSTGGPHVSDILKQIANWDKLSDLSPTGWNAFYNKLRRFSLKWKIALVPFEAINLKYESGGHGLCICGLGLERWKQMGDALFIILEYLLPTTNAIISTSVESIANGSSSANGYELLWILLKEFIPMLDRSKPAVFPSWPESDDIFQFARLILMYCTLSHHRGPPYSEALKSRMFLSNVRGRYATLASQYRAMVGTYCPGRDGVTRNTAPLPNHLTVMELARTFYDTTVESPASSSTMHPPVQAFITTSYNPSQHTFTPNSTMSPPSSTPPSLTPSTAVSSITEEAHTTHPSHLQGYCANAVTRYKSNRRSAPDPTSRNSRPPSSTPRHEAPCEACGKYGHPAVRCDMLAMALFLQRYCKDRSHAETIRQNEHRWVERNKKYLPRDDRSPRLILANYCAEMNFTEDQVDNELDWDYLYAPTAEDRPIDE